MSAKGSNLDDARDIIHDVFFKLWNDRRHLTITKNPCIPININKDDDDKLNHSVNYEIGEQLPTPIKSPGDFSKGKGNQGWIRK